MRTVFVKNQIGIRQKLQEPATVEVKRPNDSRYSSEIIL